MKSIAMLAVAVGLAVVGTATLTFAQTPQPGGVHAARHAKLDTNGDGVIDRGEAAANPRMAGHFDTLDANKDGRITAEERPKKGGKPGRSAAGGRMAQLDTDKDGRFSRDELAGKDRALQNFAAIDINRDGFLTREEMAAYHKTRRGERSARPQQ